MKKLMFLFVVLLFVSSVQAAEIKEFVNDQADIINQQEEQQISAALQSLYQKDLAQIAVVTVSSLEGQSIEQVAFDLAEGNLGTKDKDNGLLLLIALEDRKYRFEVGRGLEPIFNDAKVGRYGREFLVPAFKQEQYAQGILLAVNEINKELTGEELATVPPPFVQTPQVTPAALLFELFGSLLFFIIIISVFVGRRSANRSNRYFMGALIASQMLRGPRGGSGGGFGGFGGGSVGGGGASGGW